MAKNIKPALPKSKPAGPIQHPIQPPRKVRAPGKPAATKDVGHALGTVDGGGGAQDFSSRQPGQPFTPRPVGG